MPWTDWIVFLPKSVENLEQINPSVMIKTPWLLHGAFFMIGHGDNIPKITTYIPFLNLNFWYQTLNIMQNKSAKPK